MSYILKFTENAMKDIEFHKKSGDKVVLKKLNNLLNELIEHPKTGIGQPEELKYKYAGCWSRRINQKHRLIYKIEAEIVTVFVLQAHGHYYDK
ncbi:MAG: Txe/YoeB family addiction module toxin [Bacteroidota bacterium]